MIYYILNDLETQFPSYPLYAESVSESAAQDYVLIQETSGAARGYPDNRIDAQMRLISRSQERYTAKARADAIFNYLRERFNITLDPHPDTGTGVPTLFIRRVAALQPPYYFGANADGTFTYSNNYVLTYALPVPS